MAKIAALVFGRDRLSEDCAALLEDHDVFLIPIINPQIAHEDITTSLKAIEPDLILIWDDNSDGFSNRLTNRFSEHFFKIAPVYKYTGEYYDAMQYKRGPDIHIWSNRHSFRTVSGNPLIALRDFMAEQRIAPSRNPQGVRTIALEGAVPKG